MVDTTNQREVPKRWTKKLAKDWTPVSNFFLRNYAKLKPPITSSEAMFIVQLMVHKWDEKMPHPGFKSIARRMGVTDASTRKYARSLERKKYIVRHPRVSATNEFDLTPLFRALEKRMDEQDEKKKSSS